MKGLKLGWAVADQRIFLLVVSGAVQEGSEVIKAGDHDVEDAGDVSDAGAGAPVGKPLGCVRGRREDGRREGLNSCWAMLEALRLQEEAGF